MKTHKSQFTGQRGSALSMVLLMSTVAIILLGSYMKTAIFESKAIVIDDANDQAKRAAESLANYGAAQVIYHFHQDPLVALKEWTNRRLDIPESVRRKITQSQFQIDGLKLSAGPVNDEFKYYFIDPQNEFNYDDPLKGRTIQTNTFSIFAEATIHANGRTITRYAELPIQLRDSPFFSNAIFYNMDMELMPETKMEIQGPTYANGDIFLSCSDSLSFHGSISAAGRILHGVKTFNGDKYHRSMGSIHISNLMGELIPMKRKASSSGDNPEDWIDHHDNNADTWVEDASQAWDDLVMDKAHNIPKLNLAGYMPYVPDNPTTKTNESMNHSYAFIEPVLPTSHPCYKGDTIRNEKMAWKAGLILKYDGISISAHRYQRDEFGQRIFVDGNAQLEEVKLPKGLIGDANYNMNAIERDAFPEMYEKVFKRIHETEQVPVYEQYDSTETHSVADNITAIENQYESKVEYYTNLASEGSDNVVDDNADAPETKDPETLAREWVNEQKANIYAKDDDDDGFYTTSNSNYVLDEDGNKVQATDENGNLVFTEKEVTPVDYTLVKSGFDDYRQGGYVGEIAYGETISPTYINIDRLRQIVSDLDEDYAPDDWDIDYIEGTPEPSVSAEELIAIMDEYDANYDIPENASYSSSYLDHINADILLENLPTSYTYDSSNWQNWDRDDWKNAYNNIDLLIIKSIQLPYWSVYYDALEDYYSNMTWSKYYAVLELLESTEQTVAEKTASFEILSDNWVKTVDYATRPNLPSYNPGKDWNGIVYCEFPIVRSSSYFRPDKIVRGAMPNDALVIINGQDLPTRSTLMGFSLATNAPMYLIGSYNADGDLATGTETAKDDGEVPAMLAADTFTALSLDFVDELPIPDTDEERTNFTPTGRRQYPFTTNDASSSKNYLYAYQPIEISAGLIAGISPTIPLSDGNGVVRESGGVHNLIRYMQHWRPNSTPTQMRYRGSMVVLYENLVHTNRITTDYENYYTPPKRTFGFNELFQEGKFPPGTPKGRTYRKEKFIYPTFEDYYQKTKNIESSDTNSG